MLEKHVTHGIVLYLIWFYFCISLDYCGFVKGSCHCGQNLFLNDIHCCLSSLKPDPVCGLVHSEYGSVQFQLQGFVSCVVAMFFFFFVVLEQ